MRPSPLTCNFLDAFRFFECVISFIRIINHRTAWLTSLTTPRCKGLPMPVTILSCKQCQQRKRKCDKGAPCDACTKAGIQCTAVERNRLPRGRSGNVGVNKRNTGLKERVLRLESIVSHLQDWREEEKPHRQVDIFHP